MHSQQLQGSRCTPFFRRYHVIPDESVVKEGFDCSHHQQDDRASDLGEGMQLALTILDFSRHWVIQAADWRYKDVRRLIAKAKTRGSLAPEQAARGKKSVSFAVSPIDMTKIRCFGWYELVYFLHSIFLCAPRCGLEGCKACLVHTDRPTEAEPKGEGWQKA